MAKLMRKPEILAPAGSEESFQAALQSRADAVYLGLAEGFNARGRSTAFTLDALGNLVARAHRANVKLYLTLNTLIFESELDTLRAYLEKIIASGVDALIVQDPATALLARRISAKVRLHASTQMTISSAEGAEFARLLGISRVVLPRELSTKEIALFTEQSDLESEVFVHGALCMAWSGQCLTSEAFSGRSANRGQCSQACRMPYDAIVDGAPLALGDQRYLLSPADLAAHEALPDLMAAGVQSLKIEGRYKGPAYVATAVDSWRSWRDAVFSGHFDGATRERLARDVARTQLTFSRGGSVGFLRGDNHQNLVVGTTPKHRGLPLGTVESIRGDTVRVETSGNREAVALLRAGMGLKFELAGRDLPDPENAPGGPLFGLRSVGPTLLELTFGRPGPDLSSLRPGDVVRLTGDPEITRDVQHRLAEQISSRIGLSLRVTGRLGQPLSVVAHATAQDRKVTLGMSTASSLAQAREGSGLERALLEEKLGALGGTPFYLDSLDAENLATGLHVPVNELKKVRRELVSALDAALFAQPTSASRLDSSLTEWKREFLSPAFEGDAPAAIVPLVRTEEQLSALIEMGLPEGTEVELDWMEMVGLTRAVERARSAGFRVILATVRVQKPGEEAYDRRIAALRPDGVLVRHFGALMHFSRGGLGSSSNPPGDSRPAKANSLHGDFSLNVTNSVTANYLLNLGLRTVTASHDLSRSQLLDLLPNVPRGRVALTLHHHIPTFHNSHCVYAHLLSNGQDYKTCGRPCEKHRLSLRDYAGHEHPVVVDVSCRNTVFNAQAQSAAPLVPKLLELGMRRFRVEFVWEKASDVKRTMSAYRRLLLGELTPKETLEAARVHERYGVVASIRSQRG
jgi:U32 family peptidase